MEAKPDVFDAGWRTDFHLQLAPSKIPRLGYYVRTKLSLGANQMLRIADNLKQEQGTKRPLIKRRSWLALKLKFKNLEKHNEPEECICRSDE